MPCKYSMLQVICQQATKCTQIQLHQCCVQLFDRQGVILKNTRMYAMSLYSNNCLRDSLLQATNGQNNKQFTENSTLQKSLNILLFNFKIKFQVKKAKYTTNFKDLDNRFEQNVLLGYHYTEILQHLHFGNLKALNFANLGIDRSEKWFGIPNFEIRTPSRNKQCEESKYDFLCKRPKQRDLCTQQQVWQ